MSFDSYIRRELFKVILISVGVYVVKWSFWFGVIGFDSYKRLILISGDSYIRIPL